MLRRVALALWIAGSLAGCRSTLPPVQFALGPYRDVPAPELWARALSAVRDVEYEPTFTDPIRGQIVVASKLYGTRETFVIQLHRDGWVQLSRGVGQYGYYVSVPSDLAREQLELAADLHERMNRAADAPAAAEEEREDPPPAEPEEPPS